MKKIALLSVLSVMAISSANAATGTITITGEIQASSCVINNEPATNESATNFNVELPTVSATDLAAANKTAGLTLFNINVTQCPEENVSVSFSSANANDAGRLNTTGDATNVDVQLVNSKLQAINLNDDVVSQTNGAWVNTGEAGTATLTYGAQYFATGAASVGSVGTTVEYTVVYQ